MKFCIQEVRKRYGSRCAREIPQKSTFRRQDGRGVWRSLEGLENDRLGAIAKLVAGLVQFDLSGGKRESNPPGIMFQSYNECGILWLHVQDEWLLLDGGECVDQRELVKIASIEFIVDDERLAQGGESLFLTGWHVFGDAIHTVEKALDKVARDFIVALIVCAWHFWRQDQVVEYRFNERHGSG